MNSTRTPQLWGLARLLALTLPVCAASAAFAQQPAASTTPEETVKFEKFVVTGSSIPTPEGETFSPVTLYTPNSIAKFGAAMPIEIVRSLPGYSGSVATEQRTNGGTGAAGVNLRGLAGTLTLLDGKRTASFDNFNILPLIAIERIEVVKDGAGSIYGSDALAGVFNTEMTKHFTGEKVDFYYGNTTDKDAGVLRGAFMVGAKQGKFDAVVAAEYYSRNALHSTDRFPSSNADTRPLGGKNGGSPTFSGRTTARIGSSTGVVQDLTLKSGVVIPTSSADYDVFDPSSTTSNQFLNFRQYTPSISRDERWNAYGRINWQITDKIEAHARLMYGHDVFYNGLAPSPMPATGSAGVALREATKLSPHIPVGLFLNTNATGNTSPASGINVGVTPFRTIAMGPRTQTYYRNAWDLSVGLHGNFGTDWTWNAEYIYGWFYRVQNQAGAPGRTRLVAHILDGSYNPFALDTASGNGPTGRAFDNPAALADSAAQGDTHLKAPKRGFAFNLSGTVATIPAGDIVIGAGGDYYRDDSSSIPDAIFFTGDLLGLNGSNPTVSRGYGNGAFAEVVVPLVSPEMKIPFVRKASLNLQGRYDYQTAEGYSGGNTGTPIGHSFTAHTPKVGLQWQPMEDLLIRATWGTGFRLPTLNQLFAAPGTSNPQLRDPLGFQINNQTQITTSGNPNLSPEESKTYSFGFVYSPKAVPGLSFVVDYYYGSINGLVGEGSQYILNINAQTQTGFVAGNPATISPTATFANLITRAANGSVTTVASSQFNISARETTGVDWAVTYVWPNKEMGKFTTRVEWNTALSWDLTPVAGSPAQSFLGVYLDVSNNAISPGSIPRFKGFVTQSWEKGNWAVNLTGNFISKLKDDPNFSTVTGTVRYVDPWATFDGQVSYDFQGGDGWKKWLADTTVRVGASNILDEDAPFAAGAFNDSYDVTTHNNKGRFVYAQLTKKF